MYLKIGEKDYEVSTSLGTSYDIEQKNKKKITKVLEDVENLTIREMCELLYVGIKRKDKEVKFDEFFEEVLESGLTVVDLQKEFTIFIMLLTTSDKTEEELRGMIDKAYKENVENLEKDIKHEKN